MTKTITIKDETYNKLLAVKREGESFSELFERLTEGSKSLDTLKKLRGCVEFSEKERMLSEIHGA
jgi:predicted CopG family antitoxin